MEKTPVEWLLEELDDKCWYYLPQSIRNKIIEQAKEMEKERLESLKDFDTWKEWKNKPSM